MYTTYYEAEFLHFALFPTDAQKDIIRKEFNHLSPVLWDNLFIKGNYAIFVQNTPDGLEVY